MRCIQCGTDNSYRQRKQNSWRCYHCRHGFVFDPRTAEFRNRQLTDRFFQKAIADCSANGSLYFTQSQLRYLVSRRLGRTKRIAKSVESSTATPTSAPVRSIVRQPTVRDSRKVWSWILLFGGIGLLFVAANVGVFLIIVGGFLLLTRPPRQRSYRSPIQPQRARYEWVPDPVTPTEIDSWISRWQAVNGSIHRLLPSPRNRLGNTPVNPEVTAYSFDRLIVCSSDAIAQFLIANNLHFEKNCAIFSLNRYPQDIFQTTMEMLRRNASLVVYLLHDCTPERLQMGQQLREDSTWLLDPSVTIVSLGLRPNQVFKISKILILNSDRSAVAAYQLPEDIRQSLTAEEVNWLQSGNYVELEALKPQALIQFLTLAISGRSLPPLEPMLERRESFVFLESADSFG